MEELWWSPLWVSELFLCLSDPNLMSEVPREKMREDVYMLVQDYRSLGWHSIVCFFFLIKLTPTVQWYCAQDTLKLEILFCGITSLSLCCLRYVKTLSTAYGGFPLFLENVLSALLPYILKTVLLIHIFHLIMQFPLLPGKMWNWFFIIKSFFKDW